MRKSLGLYLHIPFCEKKCAYCDFYSVFKTEGIFNRYLEVLISEIKKWGGVIDRPIDTVYIGGGTPSLLEEKIIEIIAAIKESFDILDNAEVTCEINPNASKSFLQAAYNSGVNRISMGAQSGNDITLSRLGRNHNTLDIQKTFSLLRELGFKNISLDLMIGLPDSSVSSLRTDMDFIVKLSPEHISSYILKIEENTKFFYDKELKLPDEDEIAQQYLYMCDYFVKSGYSQYEISNFSKENFESRHNLRYWKNEEYIGIGPAAHSFFGGERFYYPRDIKSFISSPNTVSDGLGGDMEERLMLALRLSEGVDLGDFINPIPEALSAELARLRDAQLIKQNGSHIALTPSGMLVSNSIIGNLTELIYEDI